MAKLSDINLLSVGHSIQMAGAIYVGEGQAYLAFFADEPHELVEMSALRVPGNPALADQIPLKVLELSQDDWVELLKQTDQLNTEVLARAADGTVQKAIIRKSQRQIEQGVSWRVYKRDRYACRYCGNDNTPLTVDHLVTWESGGPSTVENLVAACRKCNKTRGELGYAEWLRHPYYLKVSRNLSEADRAANVKVLETLDAIPRLEHKRTR
jgi:5-methylcytosine-specific restriction endonuclease McrA